MIYCMSDIHGEIDRYKAMLEKINFSDDDTMYILGDVIDKKPYGVDILLDIMARPNVKMIMGNHENLALADLFYRVDGVRLLWLSNGGGSTRKDLLYHRPLKEMNKVLRYLRDLPDHLEIEVKGRVFHLVHGYVGKDTDERIWGRPDIYAEAPFEDKTVIIGHTPTIFLREDKEEKPLTIWHGNGVICIDCGCGNESDLRRLACLRLDDMEEFYV